VGAHLVGTSRSPGKLERAASVAPLVAVEATEGWPERVREATGGHGIDVLLDLVGASYLPGNQRVLASGARHVVVGIPGGARGEIDLSSLMRKRVEMRGTVLRSRSGEERAALVRAFQRDVLPGFVDGSLRPVVDGRLPAEQAAEAHRVIEENRNFGKLVLVW